MQKYLEGLTALHSAHMQAEGSRAAGRPVRRDPVITEHPLIRTHPVTGWKSVFFNPGFVTEIVGIPRVESNAVINYLNEIVTTTQELHVRFQWKKNDVAFWDNRICVSDQSRISCDSSLTLHRITRHHTALRLTVVMLSGSLPKPSAQSLTRWASRRKTIIVLFIACRK